MSHTKFYLVFRSLENRCNRKNVEKYRIYGARGIKCEWKSFEKFRDDMYESYLQHHKEFGDNNTSIDRIDNNGNYCKKNCKWATNKEQANNRRNNRILNFNGEKHTLQEWCKITNMPRTTLHSRINKHHWSVERALGTPYAFRPIYF